MDFQNRIKSKFNQQSGLKIDNPDALVDIHHILMKEYGWIPIEEFKALPLTTIWNLLSCIQEDRAKEKAESDKMKSKGKGRR